MAKKAHSALSICLIVKDEAELLPGCLESIKDMADQIVVVDTGSSDETVQIAQAYGAEIYHFQWINDFAAARNASIKHATGDWILWIDADERLSSDSVDSLRKLLKPEANPVKYSITIRNFSPNRTTLTLSDGHRLFTNSRGIGFEGKIHEQVSRTVGTVNVVDRKSNVFFDHLGYSFTGQKKIDKLQRNGSILELEVEAFPNNAYYRLTLGHNLKESGRLEEAIKQYQIALELQQFPPPMEAWFLNVYAETLFDLKQYSQVQALIDRSLQISSFQNAAHFLNYKMAIHNNDLQIGIMHLQKILKQRKAILQKGSAISSDYDLDEGMIWNALAEIYARCQRWQDAAEAFKRTIELGGKNPKVLKSYFNALERSGDWQQGLDVLGELIQLEGEQPIYLKTTGLTLIRLQQFEAALEVYQRLDKIQPNEPEIRRKIASLLAKTGQLDRVQDWL